LAWAHSGVERGENPHQLEHGQPSGERAWKAYPVGDKANREVPEDAALIEFRKAEDCMPRVNVQNGNPIAHSASPVLPDFEMTFEPMTIEHLGLRLYSTLPPVISEFVSNAYDAEAPKVEIHLPKGHLTPKSEVTIRDFGHGMAA
jgi:hypothetical protein